MKVLVLGGTGTVGSQVLRELLERECKVRVPKRLREKEQLISGPMYWAGLFHLAETILTSGSKRRWSTCLPG